MPAECGLGAAVRQRRAPVCPAQLDEQSGARTRWSAPLFFSVNAAGAGATLGVSEIASVLVLDTPQACDAFLRTQARCARWRCWLCPCGRQLREQLSFLSAPLAGARHLSVLWCGSATSRWALVH